MTDRSSTPSTSRFRFHGSTSSIVTMNRNTFNDVIAKDPYVESDRICQTSPNFSRESSRRKVRHRPCHSTLVLRDTAPG